jgi:hypothetical protein
VPADAQPPKPTGLPDSASVVDLPALYLRRLAVHSEEQRRSDQTKAANVEADEGIERLRLAGHALARLEPVPDSPEMIALREACIAAAVVGEGPHARDFARRRQEYFLVEMAMLGDHEEALARRDQVRAALALAFGDQVAGGTDDAKQVRAEIEQIRAETKQIRAGTERIRAGTDQLRAETEQLRAETERVRARLLAAGVDPDAEG